MTDMRQTLTTLTAALMALAMIATPALGAATAGGVQPLALGVDLGQPDAPDDVVNYGVNAAPGLIVEVETQDDLANLKQWANASDDRLYLESYNATNAALIAVPPGDIKGSLTSAQTWVGGEKSISSLGYVTGWTWDRRVGYTEPIRSPDSADSHEKPRAAWWAEARTAGTYSAGQMAYSEDALNSNLTHTRGLVGADSVSVTGHGVDVAVIDSGVDFGNGSLYGSGVAGSDMRVTDAHDFVGGESVNLSVPRENLTTELAKMSDPNGHGSWVSSAVLNAKTGIAPNASLMAYRTLNAEGQGSTSDIRAAIERANAQGADIIVMSLGSPMYSEGMADALKYALSEDGNVTGAFVAAGNSYTSTRYVSSPADVDGVLAVSATNAANASTSKKAYFANVGPDTGFDGSGGATRGEVPDTAAPGMKISAPVFSRPIADGGTETTERLSGTSMSAPIAAGVGALLLDADSTLVGSPTEFRDVLVNSGAHTPNIGVTQSEGGMVNASRAINGYDSADAPDRDLPDKTAGRDAANRVIAGDVGTKLARISEVGGGLW